MRLESGSFRAARAFMGNETGTVDETERGSTRPSL